MTDTITLTGLVATVPYVVNQSDKVPFVSFRLASSQRYFDRRTSQWVAGDTNWYTVTAFRALAVNTAASVHKGDRVLVAGRLRIRRWEAGEKNGLAVDVEAESIGHDLVWGTARYERSTQRDAAAPADTATLGASTVHSTAAPLADSNAPANVPSVSPAGEQEGWLATTPGRADDNFVAVSADSIDVPF